MDIWGTGSFENSAAQDFLLELGEDGSVALREALEVVTDPDTEFVAPEEGARALAAAAALAALSGESGNLPPEVKDALRRDPTEEDLSDLACAALERLLSADSDLATLWSDPEDTQSWRTEVEPLLKEFKK